MVITVDSTANKVVVNVTSTHYLMATASFSNSTTASYSLGYMPTGGGAFTLVGAPNFVSFWARPDNSYQFDTKTISMSGVLTGLAPGTYEVGLVGSSPDFTLFSVGSNLTVQKLR
jgi:hypothetical protein